MHSGSHRGFSILAVEVVYVTFTAGLYAGLQQRALGLGSPVLGNFLIVIAIPTLAQALDCLAHRIVGGSAPERATLAVCVFTGVSALFHLYVMRRGTFLSGSGGRTLLDDFRRMPRLVLGFVAQPLTILGAYLRISEPVETEIPL